MLDFKQFFHGFYSYLRSNNFFYLLRVNSLIIIDNTKTPSITTLSGVKIQVTNREILSISKLPEYKFIATYVPSPVNSFPNITNNSLAFQSDSITQKPMYQIIDIVQKDKNYEQRLEYLKLLDLETPISTFVYPDKINIVPNLSYDRIWGILRSWMTSPIILRKRDHVFTRDFDIFLKDISIKQVKVVDKKLKDDQYCVIVQKGTSYYVVVDGIDKDTYLDLKYGDKIIIAKSSHLGVFISKC